MIVIKKYYIRRVVIILEMGCGSSSHVSSNGKASNNKRMSSFRRISDTIESFEQLQDALRRCGLESSQLCIGIDCTASNEYTGSKSFGGKSLHYLDPAGEVQNPYEVAISIIGKTLATFDEDNLIPVYGFGDVRTKANSVFSFSAGPCVGLDGALTAYRSAMPHVRLSGPTSFAPLIDQVCEDVRRNKEYTILLILTDGCVSSPTETEKAIIRASKLPISIVCIGLGDGPFDEMERFDDELPSRKFDNFQFVEANKIFNLVDSRQREVIFAIHALQEVPEQYRTIQKLGLLN